MLYLFDIPDLPNWVNPIWGLLLSISWALYLRSLKPHLEINNPEFDSKLKIIEIPIKNKSKFYVATKISIEVAVIEGDKTYHLETDFKDFAFLPPLIKNDTTISNIRKFKAYKISNFLETKYDMNFENVIEILKNKDVRLRVRLHSTHSFSGLGKTFEKTFSNEFLKKTASKS